MPHYQHHSEISALVKLFSAPPNAAVADNVHALRLRADEPPWQATGITLQNGQAYSLFARGTIQWSARNPELYGEPMFHLWARVNPGGRIVNLSAASGSFIADRSGQLELGIYMGMWQDEYGSLSDAEAYRDLQGEIEVAAVSWRDNARAALSRIASPTSVPQLLIAERVRLERECPPPSGWSYLPETGHSDMYRTANAAGAEEIIIDAMNDQGIIRYPVDLMLKPDTELAWRWRVDAHPSRCREDRARCHDYVSIAAEFDNGRDLTWIWSQFLDPGTHFPCPVKAWSARETHYVVRSAADPLSRWCEDRRRVYDDVEVSQGRPPARIVAVWLITVSTFSHRRARARFADIRLGNAERHIQVL